MTDSSRKRTVVVTLPRGTWATPNDFEEVLLPYMRDMEAFGTVGVGYIWQVTIAVSFCVESMIAGGNFTIKGDIHVEVSRLT